MTHTFIKAVLIKVSAIFLLFNTPLSYASNDAVILMYHHVSNSTPASTSVSPETFEKHLDYLEDNHFNVLALSTVINYLVNDKSLPEKTVVFTFDDAYKSVYNTAYPALKKRNWPFTVFVTTQYIDSKYNNFMSWQQLQEVARYGAEIGNHSHTHAHLIRHGKNESQAQWLQRTVTEIDTAQTIIGKHIKYPLPVFAYPYGEYTTEIQALLKNSGYYGIGQHSGAVGPFSNPYALPRFPMAVGYDDMKNFAIKVNSKALPVTATYPADGVLPPLAEHTQLLLKVADNDYSKKRLACYASGQGRIQAQWHPDDSHELVVIANENLKPGRTKFNCTAPSLSKSDIFYWYSFLWIKPEANGEWYRE